jgi:hypothetical protein
MTSLLLQTSQLYFGICTPVGSEGSSNMQRCQDALPFAPRQLDIGDEQESCNQDADSSMVQVQDSCTQLLVPSCRHDSAHDPQLSGKNGINNSIIQIYLVLWIATSG